MIHDEFRLTQEQITAQNERSFDWSLRQAETLAGNITADIRLKRYFEALQTFAKQVTDEHGAEIEKFEAIPHKWELDENFSSIGVRWTSPQGVFYQVVMPQEVVQPTQYTLVRVAA